MKFRETTPKRQNITKEVSDYHEHKINLQKDFRGHCGYCNDRDWPRREFFEIDHFVPKVMLTTIKDTDYSNLVYSCRSCNNAKRKNGQQEKNTYIMMGIKVG
jgi:5-methylcytosine-specific restriction endonuclease McrA